MTNNNYQKVLLYLKQFEGDGKYHEVESILGDIALKEKKEILIELAREDLIQLEGGRWTGLPLMAFIGGGHVDWVGGSDQDSTYEPYKGRIKFKGSKYIKEDIEMADKGKYNIKVEGNSTANVIIGSPGATINNKTEIIGKVKHIVETIKNDDTLNQTEKDEAIATFTQLENEIKVDKPNSATIENVLTVGAKIASIGSLVVALTRLLFKI